MGPARRGPPPGRRIGPWHESCSVSSNDETSYAGLESVVHPGHPRRPGVEGLTRGQGSPATRKVRSMSVGKKTKSATTSVKKATKTLAKKAEKALKPVTASKPVKKATKAVKKVAKKVV